jgi:hypothetical protein
MPLKADTKITKNPNAKTFYLTIPAFLAQDSAFPFDDGTAVEVEIVTEEQTVGKGSLIVRRTQGTSTKRK